MIIDFKTLKLHSRPNQFLLAPEGYCEAATPHALARTYPYARPDLQTKLVKIILDTPRVREADQDGRGQFHFIATTALLRFKDDVNVQFIDLGEGQSSFAIYSRSRVGHSDLGTNKKRVMRWVEQLA